MSGCRGRVLESARMRYWAEVIVSIGVKVEPASIAGVVVGVGRLKHRALWYLI